MDGKMYVNSPSSQISTRVDLGRAEFEHVGLPNESVLVSGGGGTGVGRKENHHDRGDG